MPPRPQPTALKLLRGNPGHRPLNGAEPQPAVPAAIPAPPAWLDDVGRATWASVAPELHRLGLLTDVDAGALALYCEAWSEFHAAKALIAQHGCVAVSAKGGEYQHPAVTIKNKAIARIKQLGAEFGMSPASRAGIKAVGPTEIDPLTDFLRRKSRK